ncbi:uridine kinase family protein [Micromonospora echinofusca]|uniref:uridine kinase family protein n=1 Tax=Micromonospora echinofusca TaxID=47858 RepID=UPI001FCCEB35|nr:hypothetical protein [Micromonospora echinofusca]
MSGRSVRVVESYAGLAERVLAAPARLGRTRLVAVDGPSGAGKTVFAARLAVALAALPGGPPPVVHTDDLLDGWTDQFTFWPRLEEAVLTPLRGGQPGGYHRYSWVRRCFTPRRVPVPPAPVVLLEGVGVARSAIRAELSLAVFVTAPTRLRVARALARDGAEVAAALVRWRRNERAHFATEATRRHADLVVDGAPEVPHDPERCYVRIAGPAGRSDGSPGQIDGFSGRSDGSSGRSCGSRRSVRPPTAR